MATIPTTLQARLSSVRERIASACAAVRRPAESVCLVAVSKTFPAVAVRAAAEAGQRDFGENYLQEAIAKMDEVAMWGAQGQKPFAPSHVDGVRPSAVDGAEREADDGAHWNAFAVAPSEAPRFGVPSPQAGPLLRPLTWHFIGPIQSNKTRPIAERFDWVHTVDREKIARRLSEQRPEARGLLNVCIEVNVSGESSKSGVAPADVPALARIVASLPRLTLRGLMAIPEPTTDADLQRHRFATLRELKESLVREGLALDTLSMGMSADLEAAIAEGATMVRVGTAIFGERTKG